MKTIVYLTVNLKNNKIYIGVHSTENPDIFDGYLGCGCHRNSPSSYKNSKTPFQYAINTYGVDSFKRITLAVFDTPEEAFALEAKLVNKDFLKRSDVYNVACPDRSIIIYQYALDGSFIEAHSSYKKASEVFNCSATSIEAAVKFKTTSNGFLWTTFYTEKLDITNYHIYKPESVFEYDLNGNYIRKYKSTTDIINKYNISRTTLNRAIQGGYKVLDKYYYSRTFTEKFEFIKPIKTRNSKIYLYNTNGEFYKEFESPLDCARFFGEKSSSKISTALRLGRLYKNYQVSLEKVSQMKVIKPINQKQKVDQFDLDGKFIKTWESITAAKLVYGEGVRKCVKGLNKHCKNYIFKLRS